MSCRDTVSIYRRRPKCLPSTVNDAKDNVQEPDAAETTAKSGNPGRSTRRKSRPSWIDRSLSCRSKINSLDAYAFSSSRQDNDKAKKAFLSPNVYRKKRVEAPANFVQDQKNYFAQVDAFELEEETPPSKERWMHELQQKDAVIPGVQFYRTALLQAVQEDSLEKSLQETPLFALSLQKDPLRHILETPHADQSSQISKSRGLLQCSSCSEKGFLEDVEVMTGGFPKSRKSRVTNELASQVPNNGQTHPKVPSQIMPCGIDQEALKPKPAMGLEHLACCKPLFNLKESTPLVMSVSDDKDLGQISRSKTFSGSYDADRFNPKDSVQLFKPETFSTPKDPARQAPKHDEIRAKPEVRHQSMLHLIDFDALESKQDGSQPLMNSKSDVCSHAVHVKYEYSTEASTNNDSSLLEAKDAVIPDLAVVASEDSNLREESKMNACSVEHDNSHHEAPEKLVEELKNLDFQDFQGEGFFKSSELHEQCIMQHALVKNSPQSNTEQLPIFEVLLKKCGQKAPVPLKKAILQFSDMSDIVKLGEGTYGEAFRGSNLVFKIVPMDGDFRVNGEVQKTTADMYTEMLLTLTLNRLRGANSKFALQHNVCNNFIETKMVKVCQGLYDQELINAWEEWDAKHESENDHPVVFPKKQLYMLFVLADGGQDLESFAIASSDVARSILIQVTAALAIAEEDCEFEHRDLHWGNILVAQTEQAEAHCKLDGRDMHIKTFGVFVHIIDFTLSRLHTGKEVLFSDLSADPLLFEGRKGDIQAETYRRMLHITKGHWDKRFLKTNCYWIHYLINVLLTKKQFHSLREEDRALRAFKKRVLSYDSAKACLEDEFFCSNKEGVVVKWALSQDEQFPAMCGEISKRGIQDILSVLARTDPEATTTIVPASVFHAI